MYFTLDKIDQVATGPDDKILIQTDHREPGEIVEEGAFSHLFALAKIAGAFEYDRNARVIYLCAHLPPAEFQRTLASVGAELHVGELGEAVEFTGTRADGDELLGRYMAEVAAQSGIEDCQQLAAREKELAEELEALKADFADEPGVVQHPYWTSVIELAAVSGAIIGRSVKDGEWRLVKLEPQTLPFLFTHQDPRNSEKLVASFLVEKAMKYFEHGSAESIAFLTRAAATVRTE